MELKRQAHCVYRCEYHLVWIPKFRYRVLVKGVAEYLEIKFDEVRKYYPEIEFVRRSIQPDHVHPALGPGWQFVLVTFDQMPTDAILDEYLADWASRP